MQNFEREQLILFYDPACDLCMRFRQWITLRDEEGKIALVPLQEGVETRFPQVDFSRAAEQLTACDRRGQVFEGMAALRQVAKHLPGLARLDWAYALPGIEGVASGVYRTVNRFRKRLCLSCGESWTPSKKYSERKRRAGRGGRR
jgi:predicted DCC family thiol-disulfide oxidoreductase YuxK